MKNLVPQQDWDTCLQVLRLLRKDPSAARDPLAINPLILKLATAEKKRRRKLAACPPGILPLNPSEFSDIQDNIKHLYTDGSLIIRSTRSTSRLPRPLLLSPASNQRTCYVCKRKQASAENLCADCRAFEFEKQAAVIDLSGQHALVTGARTNLGRAIVLSLLRKGAEVYATSRFPDNALDCYSKEPDHLTWLHRIHFQKLDLRDIPAVEDFASMLSSRLPSLEILIHNAAQTNRSPLLPPDALSQDEKIRLHELLAETNSSPTINSWVMRLHQVSTVELLEVLIINAASPALLTARLKPIMSQSPFPHRHVICVVGADGQFHRRFKSPGHPHVNMSKAALHMLTRSCAEDFSKDRIYLNSVDPGWLSDERPLEIRSKSAVPYHLVPLDYPQGAARVLDPISLAHQGSPIFGLLWKDFRPALW